jgi:hypothetical protein
MRRLLAIGSAGLLAFTVIATPAPAADLGMPLKAAPITEAPPPAVDWLPLALALLFAAAAGSCIALCETGGPPAAAVTNGGNSPHALPSS